MIVLSRKCRRGVWLRNIDRLIFVWLYRFFPSILSAITVVKPETVIRWIAGQVTDAFPWDEAPRHLVRDRDGAFPPHSCNGNPRSPYRTTLAVAERPR